MTNKDLQKFKLPDKSGVYFFLKGKEILYIGKATSLKDRVKSYFSKDLIETRGPVLVDMLFKSDKIDWQVTDSVLEALILEAELIKKYQPKYNTKEKSDKSFNYVCITKSIRPDESSGAVGEKLPKVIIVRGKDIKQNFVGFGAIFGPYPNSSQLKEALKIVRKIFPFLDDKSKNYLEFYKQINLIPDLSDTEMYLQNIKNIKLFFQGKKKEIFRNLKKEMGVYSKNREFEKAGEIKRQLFALQHINDIALIKNNSFTDSKIFDPAPFFGRIEGNKVGPSDAKISLSVSQVRIEAYDIAHMGGKNMVGVMTVLEDGEVAKSEYKKFKIQTQDDANDTEALAEILERRFSHTEWTFPSLVVVDGGVAQLNRARKILKDMKINIPVVSVVKDDRHKAKGFMGDKVLSVKYEREILLANSEAHRFAINYHKSMRNKNFLK